MDTRLVNVITLAYLGDAIYEVYVREYLINMGYAKVEILQKKATNYVSAKNQCRIVNALIDLNFFTEEEMEVFKRGRNYKRESHPKNTDIITYKNSTGFEAIIGYLYLEGKKERLEEIIKKILEEFYEKDN